MCKPQMDPYLNKLIHKIVVVVLSFGSLLTFGYEGKTPFIIKKKIKNPIFIRFEELSDYSRQVNICMYHSIPHGGSNAVMLKFFFIRE